MNDERFVEKRGIRLRPSGFGTAGFLAIHDPHVPRRLGSWLSARAGIPLRDRTTTEERAADFAAIRQQLEQSGRLGKLVGSWIDRIGSRTSDSGS